MEKNIVLTGMPGAGKSTLGVLLAKALNYDFLDTDLLLQKAAGKKLFEIMEERGMDGFLALENETLARIHTEKTVIATGGSAVFGKEAMEQLKKDGIVVYIKLSCEEIEKRVKNIKTRGIAMRKGKTIADVYKERTPLYEKYADIIVDGENTTIEEGVELLLEHLTLDSD